MITTPPDLLCFALHSTAQAVHAAYAPLLQPYGLTYPQYLVIATLAAQGDQTVGQLGSVLRLQSNTLTPLLKRMQTAGWLDRRRDGRDERQVRLALTPSGRALAAQLADVPRAFADRTGIPSGDLADLRDILIALRDRLRPAYG
jgi:DNA-binding MarR family transcriptional regulator